MAVYVVTKTHAVIEYEAPNLMSPWIARNREGHSHLIYYNTCLCTKAQIKLATHPREHEQWIAWIDDREIVSIGFEKPTIITVAPFAATTPQMADVRRIYEWVSKRQEQKKAPQRLRLTTLKALAGL